MLYTSSDSHQKFLVLYTNADSLHNKINELKLIISSFQYKPSLIAITEVKHKNKWQTSLSELALSGYDLYSNDLDSSSRGIIVYVSKNIKSKQIYSNNTALEHLILEIEFNHARLVVTTMYHSPSSTNENNDAINHLISEICNQHVGNNLIIGDFNYHLEFLIGLYVI